MAAFKALSLPGLDSVTVAMSLSRELSIVGVWVVVIAVAIGVDAGSCVSFYRALHDSHENAATPAV